MSKQDYYDVLGISKNASTDEIKSAYKKLAKKFHPDVSKEENSEQKFKEVLEAYNVLSSPEKRQAYNQFGFEGEKFSGFSGFQGFDFRNFSSADFDFEDLFSGFGSIFGEFGERRESKRMKGSDLRHDLGISFEEAAFGTKKEIEIERIESCSSCNGSGARDAKSISVCDNCHGSGVVRKTQKTFFGMLSTQSTCSKCRGKGKLIKEKCPKCNGLGKIRARKKIQINIPEGVNTGMHLRLRGEGNEDAEIGEKGELFVVIYVEPHEHFKRDNGDIFVETPISLSEAVLGGEIEVPTLKGKAKLKIPEGTQSNALFKLKKQGIKDYRTEEKGDEFVKVIVSIPKNLSKKQKELFEELKKTEKESMKKRGFFGVF